MGCLALLRGILLTQGEPGSPALQADSLPPEPPRSSFKIYIYFLQIQSFTFVSVNQIVGSPDYPRTEEKLLRIKEKTSALTSPPWGPGMSESRACQGRQGEQRESCGLQSH